MKKRCLDLEKKGKKEKKASRGDVSFAIIAQSLSDRIGLHFLFLFSSADGEADKNFLTST